MSVQYPAVFNSGSGQWSSLAGKVPFSDTSPLNPSIGDIWVDSSSTPPSLKVYNGSIWTQLGAAVDDSELIISSRMFS